MLAPLSIEVGMISPSACGRRRARSKEMARLTSTQSSCQGQEDGRQQQASSEAVVALDAPDAELLLDYVGKDVDVGAVDVDALRWRVRVQGKGRSARVTLTRPAQERPTHLDGRHGLDALGDLALQLAHELAKELRGPGRTGSAAVSVAHAERRAQEEGREADAPGAA